MNVNGKYVPPNPYRAGRSAVVQTRLKEQEAQALEQWAEALGLTKAEVLRGLVRQVLDVPPSMSRLGDVTP